MERAPIYSDIADGPDEGEAWWLQTDDGVRIRVGLFGKGAPNGTVLLFPGRTEYIEKYCRTAGQLAERGYATLAIDWRGQGLADRLVRDTMAGHVLEFSDYQHDVAAMIAAAQKLKLPRPWHLLAHSMGGCIGLRSVIEGLPVASCAFSAPMWGIQMSEALRPVAWSLSWGGRQFGMGHVMAPGSPTDSYVLTEPFATNKLTNDQEMYQYMIDQARKHPELSLGGPSLRWLHEALRECRDLAHLPSPNLPCHTVLGTNEDIVDIPAIRNRMAHWSAGKLEEIVGAKHEPLMDTPEVRGDAVNHYCDLFDAANDVKDRGLPAAAERQAR